VTRLVFVCGHAGAGKTTLAKRLIEALMNTSGEPLCLLDKDTLYGRYSGAVMNLLGQDADDRDSPLFLEHLRDPEYRSLIDTARDNLELGIGVLVVAPLSREVREGKLFDRDWLGVTPGVDIHVVWVHVPDEIAHERILARNQPGDTYKLAHWDEYRQRRFVPDSPTSRRLLMFDNHAPSRDAEAGLVATILRKP
jgi:predicted kinase